MVTIERTVDIPPNRHLSLHLPKTVPSGRVNIVLVVSRDEPSAKISPEVSADPGEDALRRVLSQKFPTLEELEAESARKAAEQQAYYDATGRDMLEDILASFKTTPFEGIDGVEYQRSMRDEWPD
jgi:hypothetical protein